MFGHDDDTQDNQTTQDQPIVSSDPTAVTQDVSAPAADQDNNPVSNPVVEEVEANSTEQPDAEETPLLSQTGTPDSDSSSDVPTSDDNTSPQDEDLIELKKQSLEELAPLVDHLDQTAEEKFRTTMMMIQATDNSSLIKDAHAAALKITDDKVRAQALLDIVNEINYFTQVGKANSDDK